MAPAALAADLTRLEGLVGTLWPTPSRRPVVLAPDVVVYTGGVKMNPYFEAMLSSGAVQPASLHAITFHQYPYCSQGGEDDTIMSPACLDRLRVAATNVSRVARAYGLATWAGEGSNVWSGGLPGISDVDTLGYAVVDSSASSASSAQLRAWRRKRAAALRAAHPVASGFDLELVAAPRGSRLGRWLLGDPAAATGTLRPSDLHELDAFRLGLG